uniref:Uncharacterized protein n=1 Tax=Rhizophora mucronata TaxID=61149 RepID=A0A2P2PS87_RHIMU
MMMMMMMHMNWILCITHLHSRIIAMYNTHALHSSFSTKFKSGGGPL